MGRKKIKIQPIKEDRNRSVTYLKRKAGLFKKAHELAVLTDSQVAVIVFGHNGKLAEFCSTDIDLHLLRYTEYEGAAERKGPQHYLNLDKDSDDNDDNDNDGDDNDNGSGDGTDDFAGPSGPSGGAGSGSSGGGSGGNGKSPARLGGVKRKGEPLSPPRFSSMTAANSVAGTQGFAQFGTANGLTGVSAKQAINSAIRQKNPILSAGNPAAGGHVASQGIFDAFSYGQTFLPASGMPQNLVGGPVGSMAPAAVSSSGLANSVQSQASSKTSSVNPTRAQAIANMSISMPTSDRVPVFVEPATPNFGFGLTPGGSITTPGGRRFSFSDVLTRGSSSSMMQRPVSSTSLLAPSLYQASDAFGMSNTPPPPQMSSISANASPQPPQANYTEATYMPAPGSAVGSSSNLASAAQIVRPFTAAANLQAPSSSTQLAPPVAGFAGSVSPQGVRVNSASPVPPSSSVNVNSTNSLSDSFSPFASADFKSSATPLGSQASSATPELIQQRGANRGNAATSARVRASASTPSTDEETPPSNGNRQGPATNGFSLDGSKFNAGLLSLGQGFDQKASQTGQGQAQGTLVQPVPINAAQSLSSVPFDLSFPSHPVNRP